MSKEIESAEVTEAEPRPTAVGDRVRYNANENGVRVNVLAYVTAVHDADTIDLGWRGDGGAAFHPDDLGRSHLPVHRRERVARIGQEPNYASTFATTDYKNGVVGMRDVVQWDPAP